MNGARLLGLLIASTGSLVSSPVFATDQTSPAVQIDNSILDALNPADQAAASRPPQPPIILSLPDQHPAAPILTTPDVATPGAVVPESPSATAASPPASIPPVSAPSPQPAPVPTVQPTPVATVPTPHAAAKAKPPRQKKNPKPVRTRAAPPGKPATKAVAQQTRPTPVTPPAPVNAATVSPVPSVPGPPLPDDIPDPDYVRHTGPATVPAAPSGGTAVLFPLTEKVRTDVIDPGLAPTTAMPSPPTATTPIAKAPPSNPTPQPASPTTAVTKPPAPPAIPIASTKPSGPAVAALPQPALAKTAPARPATQPVPPVPKPRPAIFAASPAFVAAARAQAEAAAKQPSPPLLALHSLSASPGVPSPPSPPIPPQASLPPPVVLHGHSAGPHMPAVPPSPVVAEPLDDALARKLAMPDKMQVVKAIDAVAGGTKGPASLAAAPAATPVPTTAATPPPAPVRTLAENINTPAPSLPPPSATMPQDANFFSLPYKPGVTAPGPSTATVLQTRVLPLLLNHSDWHLQIEAFSGATDKDPTDSRRLALSRALAVREWLLARGVKPQRLDVHALGADTDHDPDRVDLHFLNSSG